MPNYQVTVDNIGTVYDGGFYDSANDAFHVYKNRSSKGIGTASGNSVLMFKDGKILKEYTPSEVETA